LTVIDQYVQQKSFGRIDKKILCRNILQEITLKTSTGITNIKSINSFHDKIEQVNFCTKYQ